MPDDRGSPLLYGPNDKPVDTQSISESNTAIDASDEPAINAGDSDPGIPCADGVPATPPAVTQYTITCRPKKDLLDKIKFGFEIGGIVLLSVYTTYTIKMYSANKKAADAATDAAKAASDQVELMAAQLAPFVQMRIDAKTAPWMGGDSPFPYHRDNGISAKYRIHRSKCRACPHDGERSSYAWKPRNAEGDPKCRFHRSAC
jgi:hypothetical protein